MATARTTIHFQPRNVNVSPRAAWRAFIVEDVKMRGLDGAPAARTGSISRGTWRHEAHKPPVGSPQPVAGRARSGGRIKYGPLDETAP